MLDKSTAGALEMVEEARDTYTPSSAQLEMIESEGFETTNFVSHRTAGKVRLLKMISQVFNPNCYRKPPVISLIRFQTP